VIFDVVSVSSPFTSSRITRYYQDTPESVFDIIHDYLKLFFKNTGIGYVDIGIRADRGAFSKTSMQRIRDIIVEKILGYADGDLPLTQLQQSLLFDRLESGRPKK
jgi:hypothetical protein